MADMSDATAAGLLLFLDWTLERGELNAATASSMRSACRRVLDAEGDPGTIDLRATDIEDVLHRFMNRHRSDFKTDSLQAYSARFRKAVHMYLTYLDGGSWRPSRARSAATSRLPATKSDGADRAKSETSEGRLVQPGVAPAPAPTTAMITYPLPIRPGVRGQLSIPEDLTVAEARRIQNLIGALAMGDEEEVQ
jgi:hypothetical protein